MSSRDLTVRALTPEEFVARRGEYEALLEGSAADPLFHSFDWLELWWKHFGQPASGEKLVVLAAEQGGRLVGALPVMQHVAVHRGPLRYRASAILGNVRGSNRGIPTEYTAIVARLGNEEPVLKACLLYWRDHCNDRELTVGWSNDPGQWIKACEAIRERSWEVIRATDPIVSYGVDLGAGLQGYASNLSGNARRSMFNLRPKLADNAGLEFRQIAPVDALSSLDQMNTLHALRWKNPAFTANRLAFHRELIGRWSAAGRVKFSEMLANGRPISVLYDILWNDRQYNIQMGFDAEGLPSGSPGMLHLGYAIEEAAAAGVRYYDFLAGHGMKSDYKRRYANTQRRLGTVQYLRGPLLNIAARLALALRRMTTSVKDSQDA